MLLYFVSVCCKSTEYSALQFYDMYLSSRKYRFQILVCNLGLVL